MNGRSIEARAARLPARTILGVEKDIFGGGDYTLYRFEIRYLDGFGCGLPEPRSRFGDLLIDEFGEAFSTGCYWEFLPGQSADTITEVMSAMNASEGPDRVRMLRGKVSHAAHAACMFAYRELVDLPSMKTEGKRLNEQLADLRGPLEAISRRAGVIEIEEFIAAKKEVDREIATIYFDAIQEAAAALREKISAFYERFDLRPAPNRSIDALPHDFIRRLAIIWTKMSGEAPSNAKTSRFVRFVAAAWADVRFPLPLSADGTPRNDLESWLGELIAKHSNLGGKTPLENI